MKRLFLDDIRIPKDVFDYTGDSRYLEDWIIVRNYDEFTKYIQENGLPEIISFDHDLADEHYNPETYELNNNVYDGFVEKTGYECAKWVVNHLIDNSKQIPKQILIHSMNPVGCKNIESIFKTYMKVYEVVDCNISCCLFPF